MQKFTLLILLISVSITGFSQFWTEDFSTPAYNVVLGAEGNDGTSDYFMTTDGSDIGKTYEGVNGNFFAGQDIDDSGWEGSASPSQLQWSDIDITGQTNIEFTGSFGEVFDDPGDIDNSDSLLVQYRIDGGDWQNLIAFRNDGSQYNTTFLEDTDFDGIGDGTSITSENGTMVSFTKSIPETGAAMDLLFTAQVNSGDEDFAIDGFQLSAAGGNAPPTITDIGHTPEFITSSDAVSVSADVTDSDGTIATVELHWGTESGSLTNTISMSTSRATYATDTPIPAQGDGTTVYYEVYAQDNEGGETTSSVKSYTVNDPAMATLPYAQDFVSGFEDIYTISVAGQNTWGIVDEFAQANGYNGDNPEEDWMILPGINLDNYSDEVLTFDNKYRYGEENEDNYLKLFYSTDYEGVGYPTSATWTELSYNQASEWDTWTSSGDVDLSEISGESVYIAFKYYSTDSPREWSIDNISIQEISNAAPEISNIEQTPEPVTSSDAVSVSADVTDSDGTIAVVELHWGTESGSLDNTIGMSTSRATYTTDTPIPAQSDGTTVYYEVYAQDNEGGETTSSEMSYTVTDPATTTLPYEQPFDTDLGETYTYSVSGDTKEWQWDEYDGNGYAIMNGYNSGDTEIDWLILPGINQDDYSDEVMTFDTWYNYGNDNENNYLKLYYSTDYAGIGDPSGATWTELAYNQPENPQSWTASGEVDLSAITGTEVYIGFKYRYEVDMYRQWEVDNILIEETSGNQTPEITNITHTPEVVTSSDAVSVSADVTDNDGTIASVELHWGTESGSLTNTIGMSTSRATYTTDSPIPAQPDETTVYYEVYAQDNEGGETTSSEMSYTVTDPATSTLPYAQPFDADLGATYTYSVLGDTKEWQWDDFDGNGFAKMNGYDSNETEEDWLILPGFNLDEYSNEFMMFETWYNYGTDNENNYLKLLYSTDYEGVGDPGTATWTELSYDQPESSQTWASSGEIDLSGITGTQVYIGFKYRYEDDMYRQWEVDNIIIEEQTPDPVITVLVPNGGEVWEQESTHDITWSSENLTGNVKIELLGDETSVITESTENDGIYEWEIPSDQTPADNYSIRIISVDNETISDESDGSFSITAPYEPGDLVITEIMYNPPESGSDSLEFIEIHNQGDFELNMNGYYFDAGVEFTFPDVNISAGGYLVVAINQPAFEDFYGTDALEWTSGALSNGGEAIVLKNFDGLLVDSVNYADEEPWPLAADGDGPSLTLCDPTSDNSLAENWSASDEFAGVDDEENLVLAKPGAPCGTTTMAADFEAMETDIGIAEGVTFIDLTSGDPLYWFWSFEGGEPSTSTVQNPDNIIYNEAGSYDVTLTVYDENGSQTITKEDYINVYAAPQADFTADVTVVAAGGEVTFTDASTGGPSTWEWTFEGGDPATHSGPTPPAITYDDPGTYDVSLTVSNDYGETTELKEDYITVTLEPAANFEASETVLIEGESTTFTDMSSGDPDSWEWTFEGGEPGSFNGQNPPEITYMTTGSYDVTLTVSNELGENTLVREDYIEVGLPPVVDFEADVTTLLEGGSVSFSDLSSNEPTSWFWEFDGGTPATSTAPNPDVTYDAFGIYNVSLEASNQFGSDFTVKYDYIQVNGTGVEKLSLDEEGIILYPNPAQHRVTLITEVDKNSKVKIYNGTGEMVIEKDIRDKETTINTRSLPAGVYAIKVIDLEENKVLTKKLIVR